MKDNKYLMLDNSEGTHILFLFNEYINIQEMEKGISEYKKQNSEWFYEDIEYFVKSNYSVDRVMIFESGVNCKQIMDL
ncbi:MAG: hypothetical protein J6J36_03115 [Clostridia bacterium]|nr:hypothetical protein [Clostridia bacterium]